jgi:hypothetical protein
MSKSRLLEGFFGVLDIPDSQNALKMGKSRPFGPRRAKIMPEQNDTHNVWPVQAPKFYVYSGYVIMPIPVPGINHEHLSFEVDSQNHVIHVKGVQKRYYQGFEGELLDNGKAIRWQVAFELDVPKGVDINNFQTEVDCGVLYMKFKMQKPSESTQ